MWRGGLVVNTKKQMALAAGKRPVKGGKAETEGTSMCGIVGAVAERNIVPVCSKGCAVSNIAATTRAGSRISMTARQRAGRAEAAALDRARRRADPARAAMSSVTGIAHTRWATHGAPSETNAHPHFSSDEIGVVHNGIIENFEPLRERLLQAGYRVPTQTDSEVDRAPRPFALHAATCSAVQATVAEMAGAFAIAVVSVKEPHRLVGARAGSPMVVGLGDPATGENFLASDASALQPVTQRVMYLEEGDLADVRLGSVRIVDRAGNTAERAVHRGAAGSDAVELEPYQHYMQKEIFEQPRAIADTLESVATITPELFGDKAAGSCRDRFGADARRGHQLLRRD
jgi:glucosamine--fructose-6-phosphate aminotransferase (isomerizing)